MSSDYHTLNFTWCLLLLDIWYFYDVSLDLESALRRTDVSSLTLDNNIIMCISGAMVNLGIPLNH